MRDFRHIDGHPDQEIARFDGNGLIERAKQQYQKALEAQRAGDWAKYGEEVKRLGETPEKMSEPK